jgi:hypothetical protein
MKKNELILFFIGLILFSLVIVDLYWWFQISSDYSKSFEQVKKEYQEKLPWFIAKGNRVTILNITFLTIAGFLFFKSTSLNLSKIIGNVFFILCIIIGAWQLFTLM